MSDLETEGNAEGMGNVKDGNVKETAKGMFTKY